MQTDYVAVVVVKAWNIQTMSEFTLDGPKGRVRAMTVGNNTLFAGAEVTNHVINIVQWYSPNRILFFWGELKFVLFKISGWCHFCLERKL